MLAPSGSRSGAALRKHVGGCARRSLRAKILRGRARHARTSYVTVKLVGLVTLPVGKLALPFVTVMGPVVAPAGTVALSCVEDTKATVVACVPLNFTTEWLLKPTPLICTTVPTGPLPGLKPVIDSVGVKLEALVPVPAGVVTEIVPVTAPFGTFAFSELVETNVTEAELSVPNLTVAFGVKSCPLIVTVLPVMPDDGKNELTVGAA